MQKRKFAFLVPAHNEEVVIEETLKSLLLLESAEDIYVVDDGSKDRTSEIAKRYTSNVLTLNPNQGKAGAMNEVIRHFELSNRYEYLMPIDADTTVSQEFLHATLPILDKDTNREIACVIGKVIGKNNKWITAYRVWEYEITQSIHKAAQGAINAITVCPGCATVYRADIFNTIQIPKGTMVEDMDFTFLIHRNKLGKIVFTDKAVVVTQDPGTLKDFIKQIDRWYTGFWQCLSKHNIPWGGQILDAEVALLAAEGVFNGILVAAMIILLPVLVVTNPFLVAIAYALDLILFLLPTMYYVARKHKEYHIFKFLPQFYFMRIVCSLMFLKSFLKTVLSFDLKMGWNKAKRYQVS